MTAVLTGRDLASPETEDPRGLRRAPLAIAAVALQVAPALGGPAHDLRAVLVLASAVLLAAWFLTNLRVATGALRAALALALFGAGLNLVVMLPNGGMPVSRAAIAAIEGGTADVADGHLYKHRFADRDTFLAPLGDVIPVRPLRMAASVGDLFLLAGILACGAVVVRRCATS
jgi:hypothetical protein